MYGLGSSILVPIDLLHDCEILQVLSTFEFGLLPILSAMKATFYMATMALFTSTALGAYCKYISPGDNEGAQCQAGISICPLSKATHYLLSLLIH